MWNGYRITILQLLSSGFAKIMLCQIFSCSSQLAFRVRQTSFVRISDNVSLPMFSFMILFWLSVARCACPIEMLMLLYNVLTPRINVCISFEWIYSWSYQMHSKVVDLIEIQLGEVIYSSNFVCFRWRIMECEVGDCNPSVKTYTSWTICLFDWKSRSR